LADNQEAIAGDQAPSAIAIDLPPVSRLTRSILKACIFLKKFNVRQKRLD
jgi:hypothetical protein